MILAVFFPALAGVAVWCLPAAKEDRALRAKLNCGALALELVMVIALNLAMGLLSQPFLSALAEGLKNFA